MMFSIIIPTCNRNDLLGKCLNQLHPSVQNFDADEYEVVVTDDSKINAAKAFVENNYPWVKWIEGPKRGPAANRNNGAKFANGEWLIFLDDDCEPDEKLLQSYFEFTTKHSVSYVGEGAIHVPSKSKSPLEYAPENINGGNLWSCNFLIAKNTFHQIKGFDENFVYPHMEDSDLKIRIEEAKFTIAFVKEAFVIHPWRKLSNGKKLGLYQEMYVYFKEKHNQQYSLITLLKGIFNVHVSLIKRNFFSIDIFKALWVCFEHLFTAGIHYKTWKLKYGKY